MSSRELGRTSALVVIISGSAVAIMGIYWAVWSYRRDDTLWAATFAGLSLLMAILLTRSYIDWRRDGRTDHD